MILGTTQSNQQVEDTNLISGLESKLEEIDDGIDDLSRRLEALAMKRSQIAGAITVIRDEKQEGFNGIIASAQKSFGKESITEFIRGIFRSHPARWYSAMQIIAQVRVGKQRGMLELESAHLPQSTHNVLARLGKPGKELKTKGKRQKRRYKLRT